MEAQTQTTLIMKKLSSLERTQLVTQLVNEFKLVFPQPFTEQALTLQLRSVNCPYAKGIFLVLKKSNQIKKVGPSQYRFTFDEPVYYKAIQKELDAIVENQKQYQLKSDSKKQQTTIVEEVDAIQHAIDLLKANGYKISKPVTTFVEI